MRETIIILLSNSSVTALLQSLKTFTELVSAISRGIDGVLQRIPVKFYYIYIILCFDFYF